MALRIFKYTYYTAIIFLFLSCNSNTINKEKEQVLLEQETSLDTISLPTDFKMAFCPIDFGTAESDIMNNRMLLVSRGLSPNIDDFPEQPDWQSLDSIYRIQKLDTLSDFQKNLLRQSGAVLILRNHELLADITQKEKIAFYTKEFVDAGGNSASLLYFCMQTLGNDLSTSQQKEYIEKVNQRASVVVNRFNSWLKDAKINAKENATADLHAKIEQDLANVEKTVRTEAAFMRKLAKMHG